MNDFQYSRAEDVAGAVSGCREGDQFIAGGTNLLDLMKENVVKPARLIDINRLSLHEIAEYENGGLRLGALVTNADTAWNEQVQQRYPLLSKAILAGASPQLRNMATNGGNLNQRTRCYYFYDVQTPCNKRAPGTGCGALDGYNRIHAILGTSPDCIAVHPSDMCVALAALEAQVRVAGPGGERIIPFEAYHRLPANHPELDNTLQAGELITAIDLPPKGFPEHFMYLKLRDRASYAFALVSVAVGLELEGDVIREARIALGGVAHKPWRRREAEAMLMGKRAGAEAFRAAADELLKGARTFGHNDFKPELAKRAIIRALEQAVNKEGRNL